MKPCPLCGCAEESEPLYPDLGIVKCPACSLVRYDGSVEPAKLYTDRYFHGGEYADYEADKPALRRNFSARITELCHLMPSGSLLEIGSAYGYFLEMAKEHWRVRGMEISPEAAEHSRDTLRLNVTQGDFLDQPDEPELYDLICLWDTIEHLTQPVRTLEKAARWLQPGGYVAVTTGDIGSLVARVRGEHWRLIHPPTHVTYFSRATLARTMERAGLRVHSVRAVGYWRSYRSMMQTMLMSPARPHPLLYGAATFGGRLDVPVYLNLGDIMLMIAQKPA
jgi:cyclopropane fatty-acyl-phospholipid synthase-like methyltransferase